MEKLTTLSVYATDRIGLLRDLASEITEVGASIQSVQTVTEVKAKIYLEIKGIQDENSLVQRLMGVTSVENVVVQVSAEQLFGKRVIVIGGGAQVAQVVLGAVTEADRHNIRGERISVDTIPLVGEDKLAAAIRGVARLPRAKILVLAGSLMGGDISEAVRELSEEHQIPVICLNMAGSVTEVSDLIVTDPVQAGVIAVMSIAETGKFDLKRLKGMRL